MRRTHGILIVLAIAALAAWGCGAAQNEASNQAAPAADEELTAEQAVKTTDAGTEVTIYVTSAGFVPANVHVPAGKPVTLHVTRKTETTCATELVMKSYQIDRPLPLNETVDITFTPEQPGELRYACGMDMISGTITVD